MAPQVDLVQLRRILAVDQHAAGRGAISRLIIFSVVVLPQPDGPRNTQISPRLPRGSRRRRRGTAVLAREGLGQFVEFDHVFWTPFGVNARCSLCRSRSATIASRLTSTAPTSSFIMLLWPMARRISVPSARADHGGDRHHADVHHDGGAHARARTASGGDEPPLPRRHADAGAGFLDARIDVVQREVRVAHDRQQRVQEHGRDRGRRRSLAEARRAGSSGRTARWTAA